MSVYDEILEKKKQDRIKYRLEQEERDNEDLKRKNDVYATKFYSMQKQIDNKDKEIERLQDMDKILRNENINLKLRINKAINYIEKESWFSYKDDEEILDRIPIEKLKNILKGNNEE